MTDFDCLSLLEIAELRASDDHDEQAREHLASCPRCQALLSGMPLLSVIDGGHRLAALELKSHRPAVDLGDPAPGQMWIAEASRERDWRFPVAIIGLRRERTDLVVVAPIDSEL